MQIIRNLELQIQNIHIRYEDDYSKPEHPFSAGITLDSIEIKVSLIEMIDFVEGLTLVFFCRRLMKTGIQRF